MARGNVRLGFALGWCNYTGTFQCRVDCVDKQTDADRRGVRIAGFWLIVEGVVLIMLMAGACLYRRYG